MFGAKPNQFSSGGGLFGGGAASTQSSLFGGAANTGGTFSFGGMSGNQQQSGFGGFGASATTGTTGGLFGSTSNNLFNKPAGSQFGQTAGASSTGGIFGGSSAFGGQATVPNGTTVKFVPLAGSDTMMKPNPLTKTNQTTNVSTKHQCLTAMKEYESKSLEELRMEDYVANRKTGTASGGGTGLFGAQQNTQTGGLFGNAGGSQSTAFGGGGLFGGQAKPGGLFGSTGTTSSTGGLFGGAATSSSTPLFGNQNKPGGLFGSTPATQSTGLFGSSTNAFGQTSQATGGLFGSTTNTGFGAQASKPGGFGLFGTNTATTTTGTSLFNFGANTTTTQSGGLFGNAAAQQQKPLFGGGFGSTPASTGGLFGAQTSTAGGGLFGAKPLAIGTATQGTSLFGSQPTQSTFGQTGSLFGATQPQQNTGLFGSTQPIGGLGLGQNAQPASLTTDASTANAQHAMLQQQILSMALSPYGDNPLFRNSLIEKPKNEDILKPISTTAQKAFLSPSQYKVEKNKPVMKVKPRSISVRMNKLFDGLEEEESKPRQYFIPRDNPKKLVIKSSPPRPALPLSVTLNTSSNFGNSQEIAVASAESSYLYESGETPPRSARSPPDSAPRGVSAKLNSTPARADSASQVTSPRENDRSEQMQVKEQKKPEFVLSPRNSQNISYENDSGKKPGIDKQRRSDLESQPPESQSPEVASSSDVRSVIELRRPGYYTIPSQEELKTILDTTGELKIEDFCIGREGYGNVFFPGITDISKINFDEVVHIRRKEVTIYPDDNSKPPVEEGLNKRAVITLEKVWPNDKSTHLPISSPQKLFSMGYPQKIERSTAKLCAKFVDYRPESGSWVFEVKHF